MEFGLGVVCLDLGLDLGLAGVDSGLESEDLRFSPDFQNSMLVPTLDEYTAGPQSSYEAASHL